MKQKSTIYIYLILLLTSCTGEFNPSSKSFISLSKPEGNKCEQGIIDDSDTSKLNIAFTWESSLNEFEEGILTITDDTAKEIVATVPVNINEHYKEVVLDRNKWYTWKIQAAEKGKTETIPSDEKRFYSELIYIEGAPYPVRIWINSNNTEQVIFEWESPLEDPARDNLRYRTYYTDKSVSDETPISSLEFTEREVDITSSTYPKRVSISTNLLQAGVNYIKVESILTKQDDTQIKTASYLKFIVTK